MKYTGLHENWNFLLFEDTGKRMKTQATDQKIFADHISDKDLYSDDTKNSQNSVRT